MRPPPVLVKRYARKCRGCSPERTAERVSIARLAHLDLIADRLGHELQRLDDGIGSSGHSKLMTCCEDPHVCTRAAEPGLPMLQRS